MIEKVATELVIQMAEENMVDDEQKGYYIYSLIKLMERFITIGTLLFVAILLKKFVPTVLFLLFFLALRKRTGGFHLNKFYQCYLGTIVLYLFIVGICDILADYKQIMLEMLFIAICAVEIIGTVNHPNMHMNILELTAIKKSARILVILEGSIIYAFALIDANSVCVCYMSIAVILCAILLGLAKIIKQEVSVNEAGEHESIEGY